MIRMLSKLVSVIVPALDMMKSRRVILEANRLLRVLACFPSLELKILNRLVSNLKEPLSRKALLGSPSKDMRLCHIIILLTTSQDSSTEGRTNQRAMVLDSMLIAINLSSLLCSNHPTRHPPLPQLLRKDRAQFNLRRIPICMDKVMDRMLMMIHTYLCNTRITSRTTRFMVDLR